MYLIQQQGLKTINEAFTNKVHSQITSKIMIDKGDIYDNSIKIFG